MATETDGTQSESKLQRAAEAVGDGILNEALSTAVDVAGRALSSATDAAACAGEIAADCGSVVVDVACNVAGSMLDGI